MLLGTHHTKVAGKSRTHAGVAELADALDLGSSGRKVVEVRVLSPALLSSAFSGHRALAESVAINAGDSGA